MNLPGVPESIPRTKILEILESLGIDPSEVTEPGVTFGVNVVHCTVFALDDRGFRYLDDTTGEAAVHNVVIRVDPPTQAFS